MNFYNILNKWLQNLTMVVCEWCICFDVLKFSSLGIFVSSNIF